MITETSFVWLHPAPWCILPSSHPARAYVRPENVDVARTFAEHALPVVKVVAQ